MTIQDLVGKYNITGSNQDALEYTYKGSLDLTLDENDRIKAKWLINNEQIQRGTGFFKNNILVINFNYKDENNNTYKGVVVYQCISKDILEGFWSEKHGNPLYLGEERCFRVNNQEQLLD
ncbi:hypothetical protein [Thalassobellus suaedae]|uniref:YopX protein domain-containing protein n=1 Tax=Thalassobellus suaedae TaxID=3074124 RepID=A0ABY9Y4G4_9FLAO|nr:hypothetical protein RHP49_02440 [Flavobacteriaceae bacterium HL-DH10]